jgi:hypothetical protein
VTHSPEYRAYLKSPAWQETRKKALAYHGRKCARCGTRFRLQVNHLTYERLGHERMTDLNILCKKHHPRGRYTAAMLSSDVRADFWLRLIDRLATVGIRAIWWCLRLPFRMAWWLLRKFWKAVTYTPKPF